VPTTKPGRRHVPPAPELSKIKHPDPIQRLQLIAEAQEKWDRQLVDYFAGLPALHAVTHMGGGDSVSGSIPPSVITPGQAADVGHPAEGFAPIDHVHDGTLLDALTDLADLAGTSTEALGGLDVTYVFNPYSGRLLEEILLELLKLSEKQQLAIDDFGRRLTALEAVLA
jgi:hypothetical protein